MATQSDSSNIRFIRYIFSLTVSPIYYFSLISFFFFGLGESRDIIEPISLFLIRIDVKWSEKIKNKEMAMRENGSENDRDDTRTYISSLILLS